MDADSNDTARSYHTLQLYGLLAIPQSFTPSSGSYYGLPYWSMWRASISKLLILQYRGQYGTDLMIYEISSLVPRQDRKLECSWQFSGPLRDVAAQFYDFVLWENRSVSEFLHICAFVKMIGEDKISRVVVFWSWSEEWIFIFWSLRMSSPILMYQCIWNRVRAETQKTTAINITHSTDSLLSIVFINQVGWHSSFTLSYTSEHWTP